MYSSVTELDSRLEIIISVVLSVHNVKILIQGGTDFNATRFYLHTMRRATSVTGNVSEVTL